jgi:hypothetical protein
MFSILRAAGKKESRDLRLLPGSPVVKSNGGEYNNNIKKMDTKHSLIHGAFGKYKTMEFQPGFNSTFYNATLPYCFAVTTGACYDSFTGTVIP